MPRCAQGTLSPSLCSASEMRSRRGGAVLLWTDRPGRAPPFPPTNRRAGWGELGPGVGVEDGELHHSPCSRLIDRTHPFADLLASEGSQNAWRLQGVTFAPAGGTGEFLVKGPCSQLTYGPRAPLNVSCNDQLGRVDEGC